MARMLHRPTKGADGQKVFLATPTYGDVSPGYAYALFASSAALSDAGIAVELAIFAGDCHVDDARNRCVRDFLEGDCTDLVFIDSDIRWEPEDLVSLCQAPCDVAASIYPFKQDEGGFPVMFIPGEIWADEDGLIEVQAVPTGFLKIRRRVLETLAKDAVHFYPKSDARGKLPIIFERTVADGMRWGGDYTFCRKWRDLGGKIHVLPEVSLEHTGEKTWRGHLGHHQRVEAMGGLEASLFELRQGIECDETYNTLCKEWDNHFSVGPDFLATIAALGRRGDGPVLETGSGITTLVLAAVGAEVHSLEHDLKWAAKVLDMAAKLRLADKINLYQTELKDGWYDLERFSLPESFSMVLCDGPQKQYGRFKLWQNMAKQISQAIWVRDDIDDAFELADFEKQCEKTGREFVVIGKPKFRQFAISKAA